MRDDPHPSRDQIFEKLSEALQGRPFAKSLKKEAVGMARTLRTRLGEGIRRRVAKKIGSSPTLKLAEGEDRHQKWIDKGFDDDKKSRVAKAAIRKVFDGQGGGKATSFGEKLVKILEFFLFSEKKL